MSLRKNAKKEMRDPHPNINHTNSRPVTAHRVLSPDDDKMNMDRENRNVKRASVASRVGRKPSLAAGLEQPDGGSRCKVKKLESVNKAKLENVNKVKLESVNKVKLENVSRAKLDTPPMSPVPSSPRGQPPSSRVVTGKPNASHARTVEKQRSTKPAGREPTGKTERNGTMVTTTRRRPQQSPPTPPATPLRLTTAPIQTTPVVTKPRKARVATSKQPHQKPLGAAHTTVPTRTPTTPSPPNASSPATQDPCPIRTALDDAFARTDLILAHHRVAELQSDNHHLKAENEKLKDELRTFALMITDLQVRLQTAGRVIRELQRVAVVEDVRVDEKQQSEDDEPLEDRDLEIDTDAMEGGTRFGDAADELQRALPDILSDSIELLDVQESLRDVMVEEEVPIVKHATPNTSTEDGNAQEHPERNFPPDATDNEEQHVVADPVMEHHSSGNTLSQETSSSVSPPPLDVITPLPISPSPVPVAPPERARDMESPERDLHQSHPLLLPDLHPFF
ncbi:hypothetical protein BC832DRAFT_87347 [Gaertneriomyces semiglobifer]|nr:hypothetical protein BC832DRAFT_87347 [Gaertneriomyces semiglobifer]